VQLLQRPFEVQLGCVAGPPHPHLGHIEGVELRFTIGREPEYGLLRATHVVLSRLLVRKKGQAVEDGESAVLGWALLKAVFYASSFSSAA